ncbi:sortase [Planococcus maritimus]|uniref:class F sortase n=1 Tax=Planococcus maritimus TaxID=192421 RepID=UPI00080F02DE|nr:class F sortase [Planococcus maritimus]ANU18331.1 sortase [Planococcus maritimus]
MRQYLIMGLATALCITLFFILDPLNSQDSQKTESQTADTTQTAAKPAEEKTPSERLDTQYKDKIAEFPVRPVQQEKLAELRQERIDNLLGMKPVRISIPSIGVDAAIEETGVLDNGEMGVPDDVDQVGWFAPGFKAGAEGNTVLAGHVDSLTGPAVFYKLDQLKTGDQFTLTDKDGREMVFEVRGTSSYITDEAPVQEIFGRSDKRMVNLITCTGDYNRDIGSHEERLVVSAELISDSAMKEQAPDAPDNVKLNTASLSWYAVRDDSVVGYRVYEEDIESGEAEKIATISLFERKSIALEADESKRYYVVSVNVDLEESEKAYVAEE